MASACEPGEVTWVEVPGGRLAVEVNSRDSEPVLAIHGISSQHATSIMSMTGARATADLIAEALS
jgi:hypothetical protein